MRCQLSQITLKHIIIKTIIDDTKNTRRTCGKYWVKRSTPNKMITLRYDDVTFNMKNPTNIIRRVTLRKFHQIVRNARIVSKFECHEEELTELRIEYVKNQILKKLKLTERPQVSESVNGGLPKPVAEGATFLSDSDDDSITGIPDEFYGKTTQKFIFPQLGSEHCSDLVEIGSPMCFSIQIPADIDHNDVESAELWVYKEPHVMDTNKHSFLIGEVETMDSKDILTQKPFAIQETNVTEWVKIDIAWKIKKWIQESDLKHVIDISCNTCEKHPSMDMLSLDQGYRPLIVINTHPSRKIKRQRRSVNSSPGVTECCREKLYISIADIGWNEWISYPPGYHAYFCRGSCGSAAAITLSGSYYNSVIRKYMIQKNNSKSKSLELIPCCTATQFFSLQLAYMESNNSATQKTLPNIVVEACCCM